MSTSCFICFTKKRRSRIGSLHNARQLGTNGLRVVDKMYALLFVIIQCHRDFFTQATLQEDVEINDSAKQPPMLPLGARTPLHF